MIISDLDGTLLNGNMQLTDRNADAIRRISELGIIFAASSGRTMHEIPECVRKHPSIRYIAYSNGTAVYDRVLGCDVHSRRISRDASDRIMSILSDYDVMLCIHKSGDAYVEVEELTREFTLKYQINDYYHRIFSASRKHPSLKELVRESGEVEAFVIFFENDKNMEECKERLRTVNGITVTASASHNIEICSDKAGKGEALKALSKLTGIDSRHIIAVGDNMNDTSMFTVAGLSLCTENGSDGAKALADATVCCADDDVAAYILERIL